MTRRPVVALVAVTLAFGVGVGLGTMLGGGPAVAQEVPPEADIIRGALQDLERINRLINEAIEDYVNNRIDEDSLRRRIRKILERKEDAVSDLFRWYEVYGGSFTQWYFRFSRVDRFLDEAYLLSQLGRFEHRQVLAGPLRNAERTKKDIERELRERLKEIEEG